jgi:biotin carboxyl carrier protein
VALWSTGATGRKTCPVCGGSLTPVLNIDGKKFRLGTVAGEGSLWKVLVDEKEIIVEILSEISTHPRVLLVRTGGRVLRVGVEKRGDRDAYDVELNGRPLVARLEEENPLVHGGESETVEGPLLIDSPMAGKIASVKALVGATVEEGQALVVLEAMKMENEIAAPRKGTVKEVYVQQGSLAKAGDRLVLIE